MKTIKFSLVLQQNYSSVKCCKVQTALTSENTSISKTSDLPEPESSYKRNPSILYKCSEHLKCLTNLNQKQIIPNIQKTGQDILHVLTGYSAYYTFLNKIKCIA